jgi:GAF domain-containing protein
VAPPAASAESPGFPQTVLRYVVRMEESVVLDDAAAENQFSGDEYLIRKRPRSFLFLPLEAQRNLTGALYLENALAPRAFGSEKLAALELLASQAALSLRAAALGSEEVLFAAISGECLKPETRWRSEVNSNCRYRL